MSRSPNFGPRRDGLRPELVVLHYTAMDSCEAAARALCDPAREVSAHYLISEAGEVMSLVDEEMRAWHAGAGEWAGREDVNSRSIGIELSNTGYTPFAARQMAALEALLPGILSRWQIDPKGVIAHSDMAPGRKIDPGPRFDWLRLARQGLSIWPEPQDQAVDWPRFRADAVEFGYPQMADELLLATLRLRFRPRFEGPLDGRDMGIMADLAARFPAKRA
ncbi:N-acetylmuramoyl-L-alanine amidase [Nioella aestuarii]|uniref:N-acetylmuramoyl-L-alanine amidase n=1 Tax=Nioella aestuarii TaxID=1662864 RepID=UPI003D7FC91B